MPQQFVIPAPGARIEVRDAEWLVRRVDRLAEDSYAVRALGISEIVHAKEAVFLSDIDDAIVSPLTAGKSSRAERILQISRLPLVGLVQAAFFCVPLFFKCFCVPLFHLFSMEVRCIDPPPPMC